MSAVQLTLELGHHPALEGQDYLVAPGNAEAVSWLEAGRHWSAPALVLSGPPGAGKSHLARLWAARERAAMLRADALTVDVLPELVPDSGTVVIDDADAVAGEPGRERALLHLFNLIAERGGRLLLVARPPAARWRVVLPDLDSRLRAAASTAIAPPDDELLAAMLVKLLADRQLQPPAELVAYLVPRMERSFDAARRLVGALDRAALAAHRPLTLPLARSVLAELARSESGRSES
ncbi:MAG: DnaA/Hda family protein [Rhodospirillaceae bacterium]